MSPFAGIGLFTAWDPLAALPYTWASSVAIRPDLCSHTDADRLRERFRLFVWEDEARHGQAAVDEFGALGYIAQTEGPDQALAAATVGPSVTVPKATVGSDAYLVAGYLPLIECYGVPVLDYGTGFPVIGVYDGQPFNQYEASLTTVAKYRRSFWVYLAEEIKDNAPAIASFLA